VFGVTELSLFGVRVFALLGGRDVALFCVRDVALFGVRDVEGCSSTIPHPEHTVYNAAPGPPTHYNIRTINHIAVNQSYARKDGHMIARNILSRFKDQ
jgi:hypothetical protein